MVGAKLLLAVAFGQVPADAADPSQLVAQLGAARYVQREAASEALEQLGRPALPALRAGRDSRDLEIRTRAYNLIQRIEGALLTQPSRVRLDFQDTPLTEVVKSLSNQVGFKVALYPETLPKWRYQRVTLRVPDPVPFWRAIDLLCDAAGLQHNPSLHGLASPREPTFSLTDGAVRTVTPVSDHGPFRVSLLSLHYQRDLTYAAAGSGAGVGARPRPLMGNDPVVRPRAGAPGPGRLNPVTNVQFTAQLLVAAESRLSLSQNGPLQIVEAVDDRGNSLTTPGAGGPMVNRFAGYFGGMNSSVLQLQAPLQRPPAVGESIKKLRGAIPVTVSSRRPDPLVVPLPQGAGKRFENPDVELTLHDIRTAPNTHQTFIEISLKPKERGASADRGDADALIDVAYRPDTQRLQLEIIDSRGHLVPWIPSLVNSETAHLTLTVTNLPTTASLKELRYHTLTRATLSIPFEFADIPMP
jgi:hypothetical protein